MPITDPYATAAQYRAVTGRTDTAQDADILTDLKAISRYLDGKLGRFFNKDDEPVARIYLPGAEATNAFGSSVFNRYTSLQRHWTGETALAIRVDDMAEPPVSVKVDTAGTGQYDTVLTTEDYELLPYNADKGPEPRPFTRLQVTPWSTWPCFAVGVRVEVTAKFGWPQVPEAIQRATIHLAAILRLETPRATRRIAELGDVMEASPDAMSIIRQLTDRYRRVRYL